MKRRSFLMLAIAALAVGVAAATLWRTTSNRRAAVGYAEASYRDGRTQFAELPFTPIAKLASAEAVFDHIKACDITREVQVPHAIEPLLKRASELLYFRFGQSSPDRYREWRTRLGDRVRTLDEMIAHADLTETYQSLTGRALSSEATLDTVFHDLWAPSLDYGNGFNRPVGIAASDAGMSAVIGRWTPQDRDRRSVRGKLSADVWRGATAANMRSWWAPRVTADDILRRDGSAVFAEAGFVLKFGDGSRRPLVLGFVYDPIAQDWVLLNVTTYNFASGSPLSPMEY